MSDVLSTKLKGEKENTIFDNICSIDNDNKDGVCLPDKVISKINNYITPSNNTNDKKETIEKLTTELSCPNDINREICIINKATEKNIIDEKESKKIKFEHFKPNATVDAISWLGNDDIDYIQEQLYKKYNGYYYGYIHMVDLVMIKHGETEHIKHNILNVKEIDFCNEISNNNNNRKISTNEQPLKTFGIVCNTDPSTSGGQHWFSIFMDFRTDGSLQKPYTIEYFNSSGQSIKNPSFKKFFIDLALEISTKMKICCKFIQVTNIQHQGLDPVIGENSGNCGGYSIYYIWSRIKGIPYSHFNQEKRIITDAMITKFRESIFRTVE